MARGSNQADLANWKMARQMDPSMRTGGATVHYERDLAHDERWRSQDDFRSFHYDCRMDFVTPVPSAVGNNASGGCEEGDDAA